MSILNHYISLIFENQRSEKSKKFRNADDKIRKAYKIAHQYKDKNSMEILNNAMVYLEQMLFRKDISAENFPTAEEAAKSISTEPEDIENALLYLEMINE